MKNQSSLHLLISLQELELKRNLWHRFESGIRFTFSILLENKRSSKRNNRQLPRAEGEKYLRNHFSEHFLKLQKQSRASKLLLQLWTTLDRRYFVSSSALICTVSSNYKNDFGSHYKWKILNRNGPATRKVHRHGKTIQPTCRFFQINA